jgi:ketosteroid isomerase-like protein
MIGTSRGSESYLKESIPMRKMNLFISVLVALCLSTAPSVLGQGGNPPASTKESGATSGHGMTAVEQTVKGNKADEQQAVEKLDDEIFAAAKKGDSAAFGKILADDYVRISPDGQMLNKAEAVDLYKSGRLKWDSIDLKNRKVRVYGNTAIVTREDNVKGHMGSNEISGMYRDTVVYVKGKNGQWQDVNFQSTKVQTPGK